MERTPATYTRGLLAAVLEPWLDGLNKVLTTLREDGRLRARLEDPMLATAERLALLEHLIPASAPAELRNFLGVLLTNNDLDLLDDIYRSLGRVVAEEAIGPQVAHITSAVPLTPDEQDRLRARLVARFGPNLEFQFRVDPEILGGVVIRVGDKLIDDSVRGRIEALRQSLGVRAS
jgi:F-type H+-transporting ATPase subunit delta